MDGRNMYQSQRNEGGRQVEMMGCFYSRAEGLSIWPGYDPANKANEVFSKLLNHVTFGIRNEASFEGQPTAIAITNDLFKLN